MPAKNKLPLTGNHIASLLLKASVLALRAQALNTVGNRVCSERGQPLFMICMMVGKGLHRKQKWASRVALLWQPSTQLCKKDVKIINASEAGKQHINLHFTNFSKKTCCLDFRPRTGIVIFSPIYRAYTQLIHHSPPLPFELNPQK